jgi:hypothetical protein
VLSLEVAAQVNNIKDKATAPVAKARAPAIMQPAAAQHSAMRCPRTTTALSR